MTERPYLHKYALSNVITSFMFHDDFAKVFHKLVNNKGVINVGGKRQTVFNFVKSYKKNVKKKISKDSSLDHSINIKKFNRMVTT